MPCAVRGCEYSKRQTYDKNVIRFFRIPKQPHNLQKWKRICRHNVSLETARICSAHFTKDSYKEMTETQIFMLQYGIQPQVKLKDDAFPTENLPGPEITIPKEKNLCEVIPKILPSVASENIISSQTTTTQNQKDFCEEDKKTVPSVASENLSSQIITPQIQRDPCKEILKNLLISDHNDYSLKPQPTKVVVPVAQIIPSTNILHKDSCFTASKIIIPVSQIFSSPNAPKLHSKQEQVLRKIPIPILPKKSSSSVQNLESSENLISSSSLSDDLTPNAVHTDEPKIKLKIVNKPMLKKLLVCSNTENETNPTPPLNSAKVENEKFPTVIKKGTSSLTPSSVSPTNRYKVFKRSKVINNANLADDYRKLKERCIKLSEKNKKLRSELKEVKSCSSLNSGKRKLEKHELEYVLRFQEEKIQRLETKNNDLQQNTVDLRTTILSLEKKVKELEKYLRIRKSDLNKTSHQLNIRKILKPVFSEDEIKKILAGVRP